MIVLLLVLPKEMMPKEMKEIKVRDGCATQARFGVMIVTDEAMQLYAVDIDELPGTISETD